MIINIDVENFLLLRQTTVLKYPYYFNLASKLIFKQYADSGYYFQNSKHKLWFRQDLSYHFGIINKNITHQLGFINQAFNVKPQNINQRLNILHGAIKNKAYDVRHTMTFSQNLMESKGLGNNFNLRQIVSFILIRTQAINQQLGIQSNSITYNPNAPVRD